MSEKTKLLPDENLSETDRLLKKLDEILTAIRGKEGAIDYQSVRDSFDKNRFRINDKLKEAETLMAERDRLYESSKPKDIYDRKTVEAKLETLLEKINVDLKEFEEDFQATKKKKGKYDKNITSKEEIVNLMQNRYQLMRNKLDGVEVTQKEIEDNRSSLEKLEDLIAKKEGKRTEKERDLSEEEKQKMQEWKDEVARQDQDLEDIGNIVKDIHNEVKLANAKMDNVNKQVKKVSKHADASNEQLESQNKKLKDLLEKLRSSDKICVDIILVLVLLGLIAILIKFFKK